MAFIVKYMFGDTTYIYFSVCIIVTGNLNSFLGLGADATLSIATKRSNDSVITTSFHNDTKRCINGWIDGWIASCKLLYITEIDRHNTVHAMIKTMPKTTKMMMMMLMMKRLASFFSHKMRKDCHRVLCYGL